MCPEGVVRGGQPGGEEGRYFPGYLGVLAVGWDVVGWDVVG